MLHTTECQPVESHVAPHRGVAPLPVAGEAGWVEDDHVEAAALPRHLLQHLEGIFCKKGMLGRVIAVGHKVALGRLDGACRPVTGRD